MSAQALTAKADDAVRASASGGAIDPHTRTPPLIFERSRPGRRAATLAPCDVPSRPLRELVPEHLLRARPPALPEVGELDLVRHYHALARRTLCIDGNFYPLGSCTMKYNPRVNEAAAAIPGFRRIHPAQPAHQVQGALALLHGLERLLSEISGMPHVTLQPAAGAHGELTALLIVRACQRDRGQGNRRTVLVPDSAHGTNPASVSISGMKALEVKSDASGDVDLEDLRRKAGPDTAALMITNPTTLGLFDSRIAEVVRIVHGAGGLVYLDGANLNAIVGVTRPGDFGVDLMHFNLHKTFSTPHGGGGPGAGPVGVSAALGDYLPVPRVVEEGGSYRVVTDRPRSIGRVRSFFGNFGILVRAYTYIRFHGPAELRGIAENAVLNANYLMHRVKSAYDVAPHGGTRPCMHEFVLCATRQKRQGARALDVAKRLLDYGYHPPTIYFPLIVPEALMIEPTETESRETLDGFAEALLAIAREVETDPTLVTEAPHTTPVRRLDEVGAARRPVVCLKE